MEVNKILLLLLLLLNMKHEFRVAIAKGLVVF